MSPVTMAAAQEGCTQASAACHQEQPDPCPASGPSRGQWGTQPAALASCSPPRHAAANQLHKHCTAAAPQHCSSSSCSPPPEATAQSRGVRCRRPPHSPLLPLIIPLLTLLLLAFPATALLTSPSAVSSSGATTVVDLKFFHIATHGWSLDTLARIKAAAMGGGSAFRELNHWWQATSTVLGQLKTTSWELELDELLGQAPPGASATQEPAAGSDAQAQADARASAAAATAALGEGGPEQQMLGLMQCINEQHRPEVALSWEGALADDVQASVKVAGAWWHNQASHATTVLPDGNTRPFPVTVVTSASMSRLPQLYAQCLSWPGPLSAVLYVGLSSSPHTPPPNGTSTGQDGSQHQFPGLSSQDRNTLRQAALQVTQFMLDMEAEPQACKPHVVLMYERYADDSARQLLYPCNIPRNLARLQARTPLVALVDIDLVLSSSLYTRFANPDRAQYVLQQVMEEKKVFIIPAFDVKGQHERVAWADALVSNTSTKEMLSFAFQRGIVFQFAHDTYQVGHNMTNYRRWMEATGDYDTPYQAMSEPWIIGDRLRLPWHDARYRGYGLNKQQFVAHVNATGWKFRVMYDAYTVHRAHKKTRAREVFVKGIRSSGPDPRLFAHNAAMFRVQLQQHAKGLDFMTPLGNATRNCLTALPWWRGSLMANTLLTQRQQQQQQQQDAQQRRLR